MSPQQLSQQRSSVGPSLPQTLTSAESKLVYLYLQTEGESTVDDLQQHLGLKKISIYPVLQQLDERGLVRRDGQTYLPQSS